jgi:hypothetical protein
MNRTFRIVAANATLAAGDWAGLQAVVAGPIAGETWILHSVSVVGVFQTIPVTPDEYAHAPISGCFLRPASQGDETLAESQAGWNPTKRLIVVPTGLNSEQQPDGTYAFACIDNIPDPLPIPHGLNIACMFVPNPGTVQPGPGGLSWCQATYVVEVLPAVGTK